MTRVATLLAALLFVAAVAPAAQADDARPLSLTVTETDRDRYDVRFQTPMRGSARLRASPKLPVGTVVVPDSYERLIAGDSLIERFTFELDGGLVGKEVGVEGLVLGSRSCLLTLRLGDGRVLRAVLGRARPTYPVEPLPDDQQAPWTEDVSVSARGGLEHGLSRPAHLLLALALVLAFVGTSTAGVWLLALGAFLLAAFVGGVLGPVAGLTGDFAEALIALVAALAAREALLGRQRTLVFLTGLSGLALGLSDEFAGVAASPLEVLAHALGLDLAHVLVGGTALLLLYFMRLRAPTRVLAWTVGVLAFAVAVGAAARPAETAATTPSAALPMPVAVVEGSGPTSGPTPARGLVTDVETYLDVGVFETRLEILGRLESLEGWLGLERDGPATIDVETQPALLERAATTLLEKLTVTLDGRPAIPDAIRRGFATQSSTGTYLRDEPVPEEAEAALVGVTYAFLTPEIPNHVAVQWTSFPADLTEMRARVIDPEISREVTVLADAPSLEWTNALTEDPLPPVAAIQVRRPPAPLPVLSLALAVAALLASSVLFSRHLGPAAGALLRVGMGLAFLATPLLTVDVGAWMPSPAPPTPREAHAITQALLENVYRAFNVRDESAVYDRLASSLADETREAAYLENRRALAFERVGGARTRVDAVELLGLEDLEPTKDGGFEAIARWTVAGSVTHFGHRHLRWNLYRARLGVTPTSGTWRIERLDVEDLERQR